MTLELPAAVFPITGGAGRGERGRTAQRVEEPKERNQTLPGLFVLLGPAMSEAALHC